MTPHQKSVQTKKLRAVLRVIKAHKKNFNMTDYCKKGSNFDDNSTELDCGTVMCMAGFAAFPYLRKNKARIKGTIVYINDVVVYIFGIGADALNLSMTDANNLFIPKYWPSKFYKLGPASWHKITYKQLEARVEHFIKTGE